MKAIVRAPDGKADYFDIVTWVLLEDTLTPYVFKICRNCILSRR